MERGGEGRRGGANKEKKGNEYFVVAMGDGQESQSFQEIP